MRVTCVILRGPHPVPVPLRGSGRQGGRMLQTITLKLWFDCDRVTVCVKLTHDLGGNTDAVAFMSVMAWLALVGQVIPI